MSDKFAVLRECGDQFEAQTIRIRLAAAKIPVLITGTDPNFALSLGGAPTSRPVRVEVEHSDLERADTLLKQDHLRAAQAEPWVCCRCHEQNEPTFDVCWSCNKMHDEAIANGQKDLIPIASKSVGNSLPEMAHRLDQTQVKTVYQTHEWTAIAHRKKAKAGSTKPDPR